MESHQQHSQATITSDVLCTAAASNQLANHSAIQQITTPNTQTSTKYGARIESHANVPIGLRFLRQSVTGRPLLGVPQSEYSVAAIDGLLSVLHVPFHSYHAISARVIAGRSAEKATAAAGQHARSDGATAAAIATAGLQSVGDCGRRRQCRCHADQNRPANRSEFTAERRRKRREYTSPFPEGGKGCTLIRPMRATLIQKHTQTHSIRPESHTPGNVPVVVVSCFWCCCVRLCPEFSRLSNWNDSVRLLVQPSCPIPAVFDVHAFVLVVLCPPSGWTITN